ncbi:thiamine phosphate synthase [Chondrinema litorale]|uniref:thiamine phosphate synthase n=1 Tax=Chondrinema litorale TaxID=2994555 RepID=UPI0025445D47|nr:thiamine phosphate synthase [Chondrinema litorale]UZR93339.1 thiamine phosphate synthase [Chondrinema litorale]
MKNKAKIKGLYLLTDPVLYGDKDLFSIIETAVKNGIDVIQYRDDLIKEPLFIENAKRIKEILTPYQVPLIISNRINAVIPSDADGIHLEANHSEVLKVRAVLGDNYVIGCSVHFPELIKETNQLPLDYIATGPVFHTSTKQYSHSEWGTERIREAVQKSIHTLVAVGGINLDNIQKLADTDIKCLASVSELLQFSLQPEKLTKFRHVIKS